MQELIFTYFFVSLCSITMAGTSYLLDFCMEKGNIFYSYYVWLVSRCIKVDYKTAKNMLDTTPEVTMTMAEKTFIFKPLGGCVYCMNIWIGLLMFTVISLFFGLNMIWLLTFLVSGHLFLKIMLYYL